LPQAKAKKRHPELNQRAFFKQNLKRINLELPLPDKHQHKIRNQNILKHQLHKSDRLR
jgi:hypothetical protein